MSSVPLHYVDLRTFRHATEAEERVEAALRTLLPAETDLRRAASEGHFGQPIVVLSARIEAADGVRAVLGRLADLSEADRDRLVAELDERVDEDCTLFVTLDKQAAYDGRVALGEGITLRGKVEAYPANHDAAVENVREYLEAT